jgi:hypothetical protein
MVALGPARAEAQFNAPAPVPGEDFHVELGAMLWTPTPELNIQAGALAGVSNTEVDFVSEFGIEEKRLTEFRAVIKGGRKHKLRFNYLPINYQQAATLTRTLTFGDRTFTVGIPATAELEWQLWRIGYEWDAAVADHGFFGFILDLKYNRISAIVTSPLVDTVVAEARAPVPTLGFIARGYPTRDFSITAELTGIKLPDTIGEQFDGKLVDFDIYGTVNFGRFVGIQGGYRSIVADYLVDGDAGHLELKGWYFGGLVRF